MCYVQPKSIIGARPNESLKTRCLPATYTIWDSRSQKETCFATETRDGIVGQSDRSARIGNRSAAQRKGSRLVNRTHKNLPGKQAWKGKR
jgi:hypothetical protein